VKKKENNNNIKSILKKKTAKCKQSGEHGVTKRVEFKEECSLIPHQNNTKKKYDNDEIIISEINVGGEHKSNGHNKTHRL
jgi:hypothetical protein